MTPEPSGPRGADAPAYARPATAVTSAGGLPTGFRRNPGAVAIPVSRVGVLLMLSLLGLVLVLGMLRNGPQQALRDLGFRSWSIAVYTTLLLSPILFESVYPVLRRTRNVHVRHVVDNLHAHAPYLIFIGVVMLVMRIQNIYDLDFTAWLGLDWTGTIHAIEGDVVARMQEALRADWLDRFMRFVYVTVYALYHVVAMVGFAAAGRTRMVKRFTVTWTLVYAIALPFYFLAPVNETWTTNPEYGCYPAGTAFATDTEGILHDECGDDGGIVLAISSINNCFPSLHNAFAWALPLLLWRSGWRRSAAATSVVALAISFSTLYLGIHWVTDLVAGVALAVLVTWIASRVDYRLTSRLRIEGLRWLRRGEAASDAAPTA